MHFPRAGRRASAPRAATHSGLAETQRQKARQARLESDESAAGGRAGRRFGGRESGSAHRQRPVSIFSPTQAYQPAEQRSAASLNLGETTALLRAPPDPTARESNPATSHWASPRVNMASASSAAAPGAAEVKFDLGAAAVPGTFISIAGLIGAGKSTLCDALSKKLGLPAYHEAVDSNPYLGKFYADKKSFAFGLQVHLLTERFSQQQRIVWMERGAVQDRSIYEDAVFARMLNEAGDLTDLDYRTYTRLFSQMSRFMSRPTALVYLDLSPEESLERIRLRARSVESGITLEYLQALHRNYEIFLTEVALTVPVIRVKYDKFYDVDAVARAIVEELRGIGNIRSVTVDDPDAPNASQVAAKAKDAAPADDAAAAGGASAAEPSA